jgi:hypothetical protein
MEVLDVINTNVTNFRKHLFNILEQTIKYNEPVNISTKDGNAVIISSLTVVRNKNSETPWKWWGSEFTSTF